MQKNNYTFLWGNGLDYIDHMCLDMRKYKNIHCRNTLQQQSWEEKKKKYEGMSGNTAIGGYVFEFWLKRELHVKKKCNNYLIISEDYLWRIDWEAMHVLAEKFKIVTVLYIADTIEKRMNLHGNALEEYKKKFDFIITTDNNDARKYNILFFPLIYSKPEPEGETDICYDLSFVGNEKGRGNLLSEINKKVKSIGLKTFIRCRGEERTCNKWMKYSEVTEIVKKSNCILEIVQEGQTAITLRTLEAIYFGKKLLTNNADIKKYSFYDPGYIQIFTNADEIDCDFIRERTKVCYKYYDECSPINLLRYIVKAANRKNE